MIRAAFIALACLVAAPALAQTPSAASSPETARATTALSALWRPITSLTNAQITAACGGAAEEVEAVEAALPPVLTPESLARVRTLHGLLIIPTDEPGVSYFFPDMSMPWFTAGLGDIGVIDEAEGFIGVRDAEGHEFALQLGRAGERGILRFRDPENRILNFVACAPTTAS